MLLVVLILQTLLVSPQSKLLGAGIIIVSGTGSFVGNLLDAPKEREQTFEYSPYYKGPVCYAGEPIRRPTTPAQVIKIVREVIRNGTTCKAFGALHSVTDIICTNGGIGIDMTGITGLQMNSDKSVSVGAGVYVRELTEFLKKHGRALEGIPGSGNITVGGAAATGAHGSSVKYVSTISDQVVSLLIVDGLGNVRAVRREEDLRAFRTHLGLLGIILQLKLRTVPLYKFWAHNYVLGDEVLTNGQVLRMVEEADVISVYWFPSMGKVVVGNWTMIDPETPGKAVTNDHVPSTTRSFNFYSIRIAETAARHDSLQTLNIGQAWGFYSLLRTLPDIIPVYSEDGISVKNPAVGDYDHMYAPICAVKGWNQCPWLHGRNSITYLDNEFAIELSRLPDLVRTVQDILEKYPFVFPIQGILLRFSGPSTTYLSPSQGRTTCWFEFYMKKRDNPYEDPSVSLAAYQAVLQSVALNYTGRSHWGKTGMYYHRTEMIERRIEPGARQSFLAKMKEFDPNEVFMNDFGLRLKGVGTKVNTDPETRHCALLDNCVCRSASDCAVGQSCSRIEGYPDYPVCKSPRRLPADDFLHPSPLSVEGLRVYAKHLGRLISKKILRIPEAS